MLKTSETKKLNPENNILFDSEEGKERQRNGESKKEIQRARKLNTQRDRDMKSQRVFYFCFFFKRSIVFENSL